MNVDQVMRLPALATTNLGVREGKFEGATNLGHSS